MTRQHGVGALVGSAVTAALFLGAWGLHKPRPTGTTIPPPEKPVGGRAECPRLERPAATPERAENRDPASEGLGRWFAEVEKIAGSLRAEIDEQTKAFGFSPAELRKQAEECEVIFDDPYGESSDLDVMDAQDDPDAVPLSDEQLATYRRIASQERARYREQVRRLYQAATGESGDTLELESLVHEIEAKTPEADLEDGPKRVASERAGLRPSPSDPAQEPIYDQLLRVRMRAGDDLQRSVEAELGPEVARQIRKSWEFSAVEGCQQARGSQLAHMLRGMVMALQQTDGQD